MLVYSHFELPQIDKGFDIIRDQDYISLHFTGVLNLLLRMIGVSLDPSSAQPEDFSPGIP